MSDDYTENCPSIEEELDYYKRECDSLRSRLAEAQSNYQTLLDAVNNEIELRKAAEDQLEEAQEKLKVADAALEFYADGFDGTTGDPEDALLNDKGTTASTALQAIHSARLNTP